MNVQMARPPRMPIGRFRLRIDRFFRRCRNGVEPDVGEKDNRRALVDTGEPVGRERVQVRHVEVRRADGDEQGQGGELDHHHDVVGARALLGAPQQQPGDEHHDPERRQIDQDRHAADVRRRFEERVHFRDRTEERRAVAGRQERRQLQPEAAQQRGEIVAPRDRHRDVPDRVSRIRSHPMIHATSSPSVA